MSYTVNDVVKLYSDKVNDHNVLVDDYNDLLEWAQQAYKALEHISVVSEWNAAPLLAEAPADVRGEGS